MKRDSLDMYDSIPEEMINYLRYYGRHFSKKMCEFAVSKMYKNGNRIQPITKEQLELAMQKYGIVLKNDVLYDSTYVANMCKADLLGSSIIDELHMVLYVKDVIDDEDGYDGIVFNRWYADMCRKGEPIPWEV